MTQYIINTVYVIIGDSFMIKLKFTEDDFKREKEIAVEELKNEILFSMENNLSAKVCMGKIYHPVERFSKEVVLEAISRVKSNIETKLKIIFKYREEIDSIEIIVTIYSDVNI